MSESVVADFVATATTDGSDGLDGERSRILLSERRLVVATDAHRTVVDLDDVADVLVSRVPRDLGDFFDQTILVAYAEEDRRRTVVITGEHERIDRFGRYLYKATLRGPGALVGHPARRGGRIVDAPLRPARVEPTSDAVVFRTDADESRIDLETVTNVTKLSRTVDGQSRPVLSVRHGDEDGVVTTEVTHDSVQTLNVLARYLRLDFFRLEGDLSEISVDETETEALVALYAGGDTETLERVLDRDGDAVAELLSDLRQKDLVVDGEGPRLTARGRVVVSRRIGRVDG